MKKEKKEEMNEEIVVAPANNTVVFRGKIDKLAPFGNDEMHKLVEKLNEVIEHINA